MGNIPTSVCGSEVKDKTTSEQTVEHGDNKQESSPVNISTSELPPKFIFEIPALSPTTNYGNIGNWRKNEGGYDSFGFIHLTMSSMEEPLGLDKLLSLSNIDLYRFPSSASRPIVQDLGMGNCWIEGRNCTPSN